MIRRSTLVAAVPVLAVLAAVLAGLLAVLRARPRRRPPAVAARPAGAPATRASRLPAPLAVVGALAVVAALLAALVVRQGAAATTASGAPAVALPYGPAERSVVGARPPLTHLRGGSTGAAVVGGRTSSGVPALVWLSAAGVPSTAVADVDAATRHAMVVLPGGRASRPAASRLAAYVRAGGILVVERPATPDLRALTGASRPRAAARTALTLLPGGGLAATEVAFGPTATTGFAGETGALARFADGSTAIAVRRVGRGVAVALGVPLRAITPAVDGAADGSARNLDALGPLARTLFALTSPGITLGAAPAGRSGAVVLSHSVDGRAELVTATALARLEASRGIHATFFVRAQPTSEPAEPGTLDGAGANALRELAAAGGEIGSGGIEPGGVMPAGDGSEAFPGYAPTPARGGATRFGEARVSRHLLESLAGAGRVLAFASPTPPDAGQDDRLAASGYRVEASRPAADVGTRLPHRALLLGGADATAAGVLRLPVAADALRPDGAVDARPEELERVVAEAATTGVPAHLRIAASAGTAATAVTRQLLADLPADTWVGSVGEYARFWEAREGLSVDSHPGERGWVVRLAKRGPVPSQTLVLPLPAASARAEGAGEPLTLSADGRRVAVPAFTDEIRVEVVLAPVR